LSFKGIESQNIVLQLQAAQIQLLKDDIARLKNQPPRPNIKPSSLEKKTKTFYKAERQQALPGSQK
jgi:hypothetical protein